MSPDIPKPPAPPPPPPQIDEAAKDADAMSLIRRRRGYGATVLTRGNRDVAMTGTKAILGG